MADIGDYPELLLRTILGQCDDPRQPLEDADEMDRKIKDAI